MRALLFVYFYQNEDYRLSQGLHKQLSILNTLYSFNECYSVIHSSVRKKWHGRRFALPMSSHDLICLIPWTKDMHYIFIIRFRNYIQYSFSFFSFLECVTSNSFSTNGHNFPCVIYSIIYLY